MRRKCEDEGDIFNCGEGAKMETQEGTKIQLSDLVASKSDSSTPVLVDSLSGMEQSGLSSPISREVYKTDNQVNEPIAIIGIGRFFFEDHYQLIY